MNATAEFLSPASYDETAPPHLIPLFQTARRIVPSDDLAWDAVQETLVRLWILGDLSNAPRKALLHLVALSSLHQLRCLRRRRFHETRAASDAEQCCDDDPLANLDRKEWSGAIRNALQRVPEEFRTVFELFSYSDESYQTIADQLGVPVGTIRSRLSRTRALLQRLLPAEDEG